jgi:hypothetical protein
MEELSSPLPLNLKTARRFLSLLDRMKSFEVLEEVEWERSF